VRRVVYGLAVLGLLCFAYAWRIEPYWLVVTRVTVTTDRLPRGARPIRIVHISDLHCNVRKILEDRLPDAIAALKPDLVVFTGDAINEPNGLAVFHECIGRIARSTPVFAVRGNCDQWYWREMDRFAIPGVTDLKGKAVKFTVAGSELVFVGAPAFDDRRLMEELRRQPDDACVIMLYHYPDLVLEVAETGKADLYCAGHTHGGQVALPWYGALLTLSDFDKKYENGLYREGRTWLYVNRGIGMSAPGRGKHGPRLRFAARPEITLIELSPADPGPAAPPDVD
jgi:predicted MPP superfamily phosphohydrolase